MVNKIFKMETIKQIDIKNRTYYFYNDMIDIKNHMKTLVFTTLDILQLKKLMIMKIFIV